GVLSDLRTSVSNIHNNHNLSDAFSGYGSLIGGSSGGGQADSTVQTFLLILESLVIIWALRQLLAGEVIKVKQAYYQSMSPLVPFLLVLGVIILQLIPLTLGGAIFGVVASSANNGAATALFGLLFVLLGGWSVYMVSGSIFAIYIVTLPNMQPRQALRA